MNADVKEHMNKALLKGVRFDGRKKTDWREIEIETGFISTAEGSARVKFGDTEVIAGVKLGMGTPYPDSPDEGTLMVNAELLPLSNPEFESGPPREDAIEISRVIDRGIRECGIIDNKKLCIEEGEKVWMVMIDIVPINFDGNLLDIGAFAALLALKDTKFPKVEKDGTVNYEEKTKKGLPITDDDPLPVTLVKVGDNILVDPTEMEENAADSRLTVASTKDGLMCAMQKGGDSALTLEEVKEMVELALDKVKELRKHI